MEPHRSRHDPSKSLVGFVVGDVTYAIAIARVREICNPLPTVALPHAPPAIAGVADYRGEVVPVVDLRTRFGLPAVVVTRRTKWIVVDLGGRYASLVVDAVTDVFGTGGTELRPAPPLGAGDEMRGIVGVTNLGGRMVFVLDAAKFRELTAPLLVEGAISSRDSARVLIEKERP
jgi:purine-binding chemotaxis protein CheW